MEKYFLQYLHPRWLQARAGFNAGAYSGIWPGGKVEKKGNVVRNGKVEKKGKVVRNGKVEKKGKVVRNGKVVRKGKEEIQFSVISFFPSSYLCQIENLILNFCKKKTQLKIFFFRNKNVDSKFIHDQTKFFIIYCCESGVAIFTYRVF